MYDRTRLSEDDLSKFLQSHPNWRQEEQSLTRDLEFPSFAEAIAYVNRVAQIAERHDHHPDIDIRYRKVRLRLTTHDAGGLTFRDPAVAAECERAR